ncbi:MAG: hypothetical protein ACR2PI_12235 [Hyphomicrobiaceae bacterium]
MLDVALIKLIATGIERICRSPEVGVRAVRMDVDHEALIQKLTTAEPERMGRLIGEVVAAIWENCRKVGLPAELAEPHITVLSEVMAAAHLRAADQAMFCVAGHNPPNNALPDLAERIVAASAGERTDGEIDATVLHFLLETYLESLYRQRELIQVILPIVKAFIVPAPTPAEVAARAQSAAVMAKIERAEALRVPVSVLETITVTLINTTRTADLRQADLLAAAADARALLDALERLAQHAPDYAASLSLVPGMFRAGRFIECDRQLGIVEDLVVRHTIDTYSHVAENVSLAIELRTQRACLAALEGSYTKAARHYGFAQRHIARADVERRWWFARLEAHYYELAAFYKGDASGLDNAARACSSAIASMPATPHSVTRARAQTGLGHLLIVLGEKEQRPDRFELAAQLLNDSADVLSSTQPSSSLARHAMILRATAMCRLGEWHRNADLLEQAATILQLVAKAMLDDDGDDHQDPAEVELGLRARMALAMLGFAELTAADKVRDEAIAIIEAELPELLGHHTPYNRSGYNRCVLAAKCHQALAKRDDVQGDKVGAAAHLAGAAGQLSAAGVRPGQDNELPPTGEPGESEPQADAPPTDGAINVA